MCSMGLMTTLVHLDPLRRKMAGIYVLKHGNLHTQHNELNKGSQLHSVTIRPLSEILKSEFV